MLRLCTNGLTHWNKNQVIRVDLRFYCGVLTSLLRTAPLQSTADDYGSKSETLIVLSNLRSGGFFFFLFWGMRCREGGYDRRLSFIWRGSLERNRNQKYKFLRTFFNVLSLFVIAFYLKEKTFSRHKKPSSVSSSRKAMKAIAL